MNPKENSNLKDKDIQKEKEKEKEIEKVVTQIVQENNIILMHKFNEENAK